MIPGMFGTYVWNTFHIVSFNYPHKPSDTDQENMGKFIYYMCLHLPCMACRYHALTYIATNPPRTQSQLSLIRYFIDFHNAVNRRIGKPVLPYRDAVERIYNTFIQYNKQSTLYRSQQANLSKLKSIQELQSHIRTCTIIQCILAIFISIICITCTILLLI